MERGELEKVELSTASLKVSLPIEILVKIETGQGIPIKRIEGDREEGIEDKQEEVNEENDSERQAETDQQDISDAYDYAISVETRNYRMDRSDEENIGDAFSMHLFFSNQMIVSSNLTGPSWYQEDAAPKGNQMRLLRLPGSEAFLVYDQVVVVIMSGDGELDDEGHPIALFISRHQLPDHSATMEMNSALSFIDDEEDEEKRDSPRTGEDNDDEDDDDHHIILSL